MKTEVTKKDFKVARIFEEVTGRFHICDEEDDYLDARGYGYKTKVEALRSAARDYTHAIGSGTYWGNNVRSLKAFKEYSSNSIVSY
jgi:hypothetical protein